MMKKLIFLLFFVNFLPIAHAVDKNPIAFADAHQEARYQALTAELRCVVCQNQSVADSNAELAQDVRDLVREKIMAGQTDAEITTFLVERYGDFVLYDPPLKPSTYFLWLGPLIILGIALIALVYFIRRHAQATATPTPLTAAEQDKLEQILKDTSCS